MNHEYKDHRKMKNFHSKYLLLAGLVAVLHAPALAQQVYTLDECIEQALANNRTLKQAHNDLQMAEEDKRSAFTNYFPSISATGVGMLANKGLVEMELQPGMAMSMADDGVIGTVTASLPLFTGGQIVNGNKLAQVGVEAKRSQYGLSENEVCLNTEKYFWQVVKLKEQLKTLRTVEAQLASLAGDVEASVEAGLVNRNDLLQVRLKLNDNHSSRLNVENALSLSRSLLAQYLGMGTDSIDVAFAMDGKMPESPESIFSDAESSLGLTHEYHLLQQNVKAAKLQKKITVGKNLPTVAIGGGYAYENLMDHDHGFWLGFATVSIPLTDWWSGAHQIRKQNLAVRNAESQLADQSELLLIRMQQTWNDVNDAYQQVAIALESIGQASENLRLQRDYYEAGTCSMSDLLEAQTLYQQSHDQYVESYAQYEVKKREYLQATGRGSRR